MGPTKQAQTRDTKDTSGSLRIASNLTLKEEEKGTKSFSFVFSKDAKESGALFLPSDDDGGTMIALELETRGAT